MRANNDVDIGVLRPDETDSFLGAMCEAFEMEFEAAKPIFYSDPYFEAHNKYVLRIEGQIVSCLTVVDRDCWIGDAQVRLAGIAGVATRHGFRRRGLAGALLTSTVHSLAKRGFHLSALFPTNSDYYRGFGWETAGTQRTARAMAQPPDADETDAIGHVRKAATGDTVDLARIYDRAARGRAMHCHRDEKRWRYILSYLQDSFVATTDGTVQGYLLCDYRPGTSHSAPGAGKQTGSAVLRVFEMFAENERARALLQSRLFGQPRATALEFASTSDMLAENGFTVPDVAHPSFMARVVDWAGLLGALAHTWRDLDGELGIMLVDPILATTPRASIIKRTGEAVVVESVDPAALAATCRNIVVGEVGMWSATAVGHIAGGDACAAGLLKASTREAVELVSRLFPARDPFIPIADRF